MSASRATAADIPAQALVPMLARLRCGRLQINGPAGVQLSHAAQRPGPHAAFEVFDWRIARRALQLGDIGLARAYLDAELHTADLCQLLTLLALNAGLWPTPPQRLVCLLERLLGRAAWPAQRTVHALYDLDERFYASWLDASLTYSAAHFAGDDSLSLEQAQNAKYERVLRWLDPAPGSSILDLGCGWGGFARYAARMRGCRVLGVTLSRRQRDWAQTQASAAGLDRLTRFAACDYRGVRGRFDHVVSLEMYETLGRHHWPLYFKTLARLAAPASKALLQCIVLADAARDAHRQYSRFIRHYISRQAMLATEAELTQHANRAGWRIGSIERFAGDYAQTLKRWRERFVARWPQIESSGRDARLRRLWEFYLAYCEAGFHAGVTDVLQIAMIRS